MDSDVQNMDSDAQNIDVCNIDSILCPYYGHQRLMSGIWTVFSVHVPDIKDRCRESGQVFCPSFRHQFPYSGHHCPYSGHHFSYSGHHCPYSGHQFYAKYDVRNIDSKTGLIPDIKSQCPEHEQRKLSIFRTSIFDVRNKDKEYCPCSGHQLLMTGLWTAFSAHVPDIDLAIFRTSGKGGLWVLILLFFYNVNGSHR